MDVNLEVLNKITETAVKAAGYRDYTLDNGRKIVLKPDGERIVIDPEQKPVRNEVGTLDDIVRVFEIAPNPKLWISANRVYVVHNEDDRRGGITSLPLTKSPAFQYINGVKSAEDVPKGYCPEIFERICKLYFLAPSDFIKTVRKLQWRLGSEAGAHITNANKSMSIAQINRVMDEAGNAFEDVILPVHAPVYVDPVETRDVTIAINIIANAEKQEFCFEPFPGAVEKVCREALQEINDKVKELVGNRCGGDSVERVFTGTPTSAL